MVLPIAHNTLPTVRTIPRIGNFNAGDIAISGTRIMTYSG